MHSKITVSLTATLVAALALTSCQTTDTGGGASILSVPEKTASYGYMTPTGLVLAQTKENTRSYMDVVGKECAKHIKSQGGLMRKFKDYKQCQPGVRYHPSMQQACQRAAQHKAQRQQKDAVCQAAVDQYEKQPVILRAAAPGMTADFVHTMPALNSSYFNPETKTAALKFYDRAELHATQCFILTDQLHRPIPVRDADHPGANGDRYLFAAPFLTEKSKMLAASNSLKTREHEQTSLQAQLIKAETKLTQSGAFENGSCVRPKQAVVPPKPRGYSAEQIYFQANGGCTDMLFRRFGQNDTLNAFTRLSWDQQLLHWKQWANRPAQKDNCAINLASQAETSFTKIGCSLVFKNEFLPACIQDMYQSCMVKAKNRCAGPVQSWERRVRDIKAAPREQLAQCQQAVAEINQLSRQLSIADNQVVQARRASYAANKNQTAPQRLSLSDSLCKQNY